jgi:hypothetical protein
VVALAASLAAVLVAAVFLATLRRPGPSAPVRPSTLAPRDGFPGAPRTQPGAWRGGESACPLAPRNSYLPPRSGCVSAVRADVDGDRRADLVLLYARLGRRSVGGDFAPRAFTLEVVRAAGGAVRATLPPPEANASLIGAGNVNSVPGAEIFVQVARISSGSDADVYTFRAGRLTRVPVELAYGGDSATKAGFSCRPGLPPTLVQRTFLLQGTENGRWQEITTLYAWHGGRLRRVAHRIGEHHGVPRAAQTSAGAGCYP